VEPANTNREAFANTADRVARSLQGDRNAFTELVERYRDAACAVAYTYVRNFEDVQDAVQEAFIHSYVHLPQLKEPGKFGPWLRRITANVCLTSLRKQQREGVSLENSEERVASNVDPEKAAANVIVQNALGCLSEDLRLTVTLSYINGYSHAEVAQFLEVPLDTVRTRLKRAKSKLRGEMIGMVENAFHKGKPSNDLFVTMMESTRKVVALAMEEASMLGLHEIGTELLLLGIIKDDGCIGSMVLQKLNVRADDIRSEIGRARSSDSEHAVGEEMVLAPQAKYAIDYAYDETRTAGSEHLHTGYLLLGLLREPEGLAGRVLTKLGADLDRTRELVRQSAQES